MQKQEKNGSSVKNRPVMKWRAGNFEMAVWENKKDFNGGEVSFKTMTMTKMFKKKDEEIWRYEFINNIRRNDLGKIEALLRKAQDYLYFEGSEKDEQE